MKPQSQSFPYLAICTLLLFLLFIPFSYLSAQEVPFHRGVNLTGWLQVDGPKQISFRKYSKQDFSNIKSLGCDVIRLPINLHFMTDGAPDYTLDTLFLGILDQAADWAEELEIHLILDNHTFSPSVDTDPAVRDVLLKVWSQMALHFKERSGYIHYEVLNEPHGISDAVWNNIQQEVVNEIRKFDTDHFIIIGPASWNSYNNLNRMPEYEDEKLIYTFHFYDPFLFTHQGASWVDPSMEEVKDIPYPYDPDSMPEPPASLVGTWVGNAYNSYPFEGTFQKMKELLDKAVTFRDEKGVPVYCGEFGVLIGNSIDEYRIGYYDSLISCLDSLEIPWTMWDYQGGFGLFEEGTDGLFNHDLNIPLLEAMGLNIPEQTEYIRIPDSTGFIIYDDYVEQNIENASWPPGLADLFSTHLPNNGDFCIYWTGAKQYQTFALNLAPDRDLTRLVAEGYALDFMVRGYNPEISFDVRFLDSKTDDPEDLPWRIGTRVNASVVDFDSCWHHLHIPLDELNESGAWYETWYNPRGDYDWSAVDRLEFVAEEGDLGENRLYFDNIHITNMDTARVYQDSAYYYTEPTITGTPDKPMLFQLYPNPSHGDINFCFTGKGWLNFTVKDISGRDIKKGAFREQTRLDLAGYPAGLYILQVTNGKEFRYHRKFILQ